MKTASIEAHEKFYLVKYATGRVKVVRRDVYWDSGWKCLSQFNRCRAIREVLTDD